MKLRTSTVRVEDPHHQLFAEGGGQRRQAQLDFLPVGGARLDAAVLGPALLDDVHAARILMRLVIAAMHRHRDLVDLVQHAVDAEADDALLAPRLEVDVAGALVEGVLQQPVDDVTTCWSLASSLPLLPSSTSCSKFWMPVPGTPSFWRSAPSTEREME